MNTRDRIERMRNKRRKHTHPDYLPGERNDSLPRCPFCGQIFASVEDLIEHQDDEGHVIEI